MICVYIKRTSLTLVPSPEESSYILFFSPTFDIKYMVFDQRKIYDINALGVYFIKKKHCKILKGICCCYFGTS